MSDRDLTPRGHKRPGHGRTDPRGVPIPPPPAPPPRRDDDTCDPYELLEREPDHQVQAVVQRSQRNGSDPATFADVVKLAVELTKERSENRARGADYEQVLRGPHQAVRSSRRHLIGTVIAAAAAIAGAIDSRLEHPVPASSAPSSADAARIEQLKELRESTDIRIRQLKDAIGGDAAKIQQLEQAIQHLDTELLELRLRLELGRRPDPGRRSELGRVGSPLTHQVPAGVLPALTLESKGTLQ